MGKAKIEHVMAGNGFFRAFFCWRNCSRWITLDAITITQDGTAKSCSYAHRHVYIGVRGRNRGVRGLHTPRTPIQS